MFVGNSRTLRIKRQKQLVFVSAFKIILLALKMCKFFIFRKVRHFSYTLYVRIIMVLKLTLYLDVYFFNNFIIDLFLLLISGLLLKRIIKIKRLVFGALFGAFYSTVLALNIQTLYYLKFFKLFIPFIMILLSFKLELKEYIKQTVCFYLCSYLLSGIILSMPNSGAVIFQNEVYFNIPFFNIILCMFILAFVLVNVIKRIIKKVKFSALYGKAELYINNKRYKVTTFIDTGNFLKEPSENLPVCFLSPEIIKNMPVLNFLIPCSTVNGDDFLEGFIPEKLIVNGKETKAVVVISSAIENEDYQLLLHSDFLLLEENYVLS